MKELESCDPSLGSRPSPRRPELQEVAVQVVEVIRRRVERPVELDRAVDVDPCIAHTLNRGTEVRAGDVEREVHAPEAFPFRIGRVLLEQERAAVQCNALRGARSPGPEPRPLVVGLVLGLEADDVTVEARRRRHVVDDQDELREAPARHARCASYMPNSSRSALQIAPLVQLARRASRIGTSRLPSPRAVSRTAASARWASSTSRSARTRAVRSSCRRSAAGSRRYSSIASSSPSVKRLTPTITRSPASTSRCQR